MDSADAIRTELKACLAAPKFARSPVQSRLLDYLVGKSIAGEGRALKSYSVAVEGLGKAPDFDAQNDTYPRVQIARLRKALDEFYASDGVERPWRLTIEQGSYAVHLVPNALATRPGSPAGSKSRLLSPRLLAALPRGKSLAVVIVALIVAAGALAFGLMSALTTGADRADWQQNNFPTIRVSARYVSGEGDAATLHDIAARYEHAFANFDSIVVRSPDQEAEFEIELTVGQDQKIQFIQILDQVSGRVLAVRGVHMGAPGSTEPLPDFIARSAFEIAGQTGTIHSYSRRRGIASDSQYGCWLAFTARIRDSHLANGDELEACAESWHEASPYHPVGAGLYAWSLIDRSFLEFSSSGRQDLIDEAVMAIDRAKDMNPQSPFIHLAATRVYAVAGDVPAMEAATARVLSLAPDNVDAVGLVGLMLVLQNNPTGEGILRDAIARHPNPLPWYFIGLYVSEMMRDDPAAAAEALAHFRTLKHSLPVIHILSAASEARSGRLGEAREHWGIAKSMQPVLAVTPNMVLDRLPIAPAVRVRLRQWLAPVIS